MAALVCLSPVLIDQSFPRSPDQAKTVAIALGEISRLVEAGNVRVVVTPIFRDLLEAYCWNQPTGLKGEIYAHLTRLLLAGGDRAVSVNLSTITEYAAHPVPIGCEENEIYVQLWADEMGKLLVAHDACIAGHEYFIGVACELAFSGKQINSYKAHPCSRYFPLVSPTTSDSSKSNAALVDAEIFEVPPAFANSDVAFKEAKKNVYVIGASAVRPPRRGSHYRVEFPGARSWPLDANHDPVVAEYLSQLTQITGLPIAVIKYALKTGSMPRRQLRFKPQYLTGQGAN